MTITVGTANLIGLLTDALSTSDKSGDLGLGVHMATHRDGHGDEPGEVDLLAATSTDRFVVGHGFVPVDGQIPTSVWPVDSTRTVIHVCQSLLSAHGRDHTVDVEVVEVLPSGPVNKDGADADSTFMVTLRETPALFDSETEFQFQAQSERSFPTRTVWRSLTGRLTDPKFRPSVETGWSPKILASVTAVAKRQKEPMWFYPTPGGFCQRVQIGGSWIGAAMPIRPAPGESDRTEPSIDPLLVKPEGADDDEVHEGEVVEPDQAALEPPRLALPGPDDVIDVEVDESDPDYDDELDDESAGQGEPEDVVWDDEPESREPTDDSNDEGEQDE